MIYQYVDAQDGIRLAYKDEGTGIPILAFAGLTRDGRDFEYMAHHLPPCRLIRLDGRGRGGSQWAPVETYSIAQEAQNVIALVDHLGLERVAVLDTSRGGLIGLRMAATAKQRLLGLCLNDVGPVIEREGLERIAEYAGIRPSVTDLDEIADRLPSRSPGFDDLPVFCWAEDAVRHFVETPDGLDLPYDPAIGDALRKGLAAGPIATLWPWFEACAGLPLALIRAEHSDVLSRATAGEMRRLRPDMLYAEVPKRGHAPFLDEAEALAVLRAWLATLEAQMRGQPSA
jgi:pimeloyl-ACP methyl ester carboxylesterase